MTHTLLHSVLRAALLLAGGAAIAANAASTCSYTEVGALDISSDNRGQPYIDGEINSNKVHMLIDTGSYKTLLTRAELDRQQIALTRTNEILTGLGGRADMFSARPKEVVIGPTHVSRATFPVVEGLDYPGYGAVVGADYLLQADLEIALADKKLKFFRAKGCDDKSLAYWDVNAMDVPMDVESGDSRATVPVEIDGVRFTALIDTGATISVLDQAAADKLGVKPDSGDAAKAGKMVGVSGKSVQAWRATFKSFSIGEESISNPRFAVVDMQKDRMGISTHQMILGRDFLRAHHVLMSVRQHRFYYSYLGGQVFPAAP